MHKIRNISNKMNYLVIAMAIFYPIWTVIVWLYTYNLPEWIVSSHALEIIGDPGKSQFKRFICWFSGVPELISWVYAFYTFHRILLNYKRLSIFSIENARGYVKIGLAICIFTFLSWFSNVIINITLNIHTSLLSNLLEEMSFLYFLFAFFGLAVTLVGWVMQEAQLLHEDQTQII